MCAVYGEESEKVVIECATKGASIGYKKWWNDKVWQVYSKPIMLSKGDSLYIKAQRIGYEPSEIFRIKN